MVASVQGGTNDQLFSFGLFVKFGNYFWSLIAAPLGALSINRQSREEAVLAVLYKAYNKREQLQAADISRLAGIPISEEVSFNYPVVHGLLDRLASQGLVRQERPEPSSPWVLTKKAIESQKGVNSQANVR